MNANDWKRRVAVVVGVLCEAYRQTATEVTIRAYEMGLDGLTAEHIEEAVRLALQRLKFMPTPAELRDLVGGPKPEDRAQLAWAAFERAVVRIGAYRTVDFDDALINATVRSLGGWERCCSLGPEEFDKWLRKDFIKAYEAFCRTGIGEEVAEPLPGIYDRQNALLGYAPQQVCQVETGLPRLTPHYVKIQRAGDGQPALGVRYLLENIGGGAA